MLANIMLQWGVKVSTTWKIYMETCIFLCFHVFICESTMFSCIVSIWCLLLPPLHHNGKGLFNNIRQELIPQNVVSS